MWLSVRWTQTAVFVLLVGYLAWRSLRESGLMTRLRLPSNRRIARVGA